MTSKSVPLVVLTVLVVLATAGLGNAALRAVQMRANLTAVAKRPVSAPGASARFTGSLTRAPRRNTLIWRLVYSKLSSPPTVAYIVMPKSKTHGAVVIDLCKRQHCKPSSRGTFQLPANVAKALAIRKGYVQIRTKKNPKGEIRGLITRSG